MVDINRLLNINNKDRYEEVKDIVTSEVAKVKEQGTVDGVCKLVANNIRCSLNDLSIKNYLIDLNSYGVDHVSLVAEFYAKELQRTLIDPTISQFPIKEEAYLKNKDFLDKLISDGLAPINEESFNRYLSMFSGKQETVNLDEYLREIRCSNR